MQKNYVNLSVPPDVHTAISTAAKKRRQKLYKFAGEVVKAGLRAIRREEKEEALTP
jgi:hypothetical protein